MCCGSIFGDEVGARFGGPRHETSNRHVRVHQSDMGHVGENDRVGEDVFEVLRVRTSVIVPRRRRRTSCSGHLDDLDAPRRLLPKAANTADTITC